MNHRLRIVALLTVRNEERFLRRCVQHLAEQGVEVFITDNGSTDRTLKIAQDLVGHGVIQIESVPFRGIYAWTELLQNKERLAADINADWFLHHDADEIREAALPFRTLRQGIEAADLQGYNAINFDEFVFLPSDEEEEGYEGTDYVETMQYYYFFEPHPLRQIKAWKKLPGVAARLTDSGGHEAEFPGRRLFPMPFILRHYIALSKAHVIAKYAGRVYSKAGAERGWHGARRTFSPEELHLPARDRLKRRGTPGVWDKSDPWHDHEFLGVAPRSVPSEPTTRPRYSTSSSHPPSPFIVGVGRSGTTLLRLMLDAHAELAIPPETHFIPALLALRSEGDLLRREFADIVTHVHSWPDFHISVETLGQALEAIRPFDVASGLRCFYRLYASRFCKPRWGDKTPIYSRHLCAIQQTLPEARFIHVIRDGRDVALSLRALWFGPGNDLEAQARDWVWRIRDTRQEAQSCNHYLEIRYETLVSEPRRVLERVCDFLELHYDPAMENYHLTASARLEELLDRYDIDGRVTVPKERRREIHTMTHLLPQTSRIGRWRTEMVNDERRRFEAIAGDMLRDLGYSC